MAILDLCDELVAALDGNRSTVFVLPTARYVLGIIGRKSAKASQIHGQAVHARLKNFMMGLQELNNHYEGEYNRLIKFDGIDPGEAILATAVCSADSLIVTADRKFLEAIGQCQGCEATINRIRGRVVCFEQSLYMIIKKYGFDHVLKRVVPALHADHRLRVFFGNGIESSEANAVAGLENYIKDCVRVSGGILAAIP